MMQAVQKVVEEPYDEREREVINECFLLLLIESFIEKKKENQ